MQQKNNLDSNYFSYAIYSVFLTALLFIVFGANGWGAAAENEQAIGEVSRSVSYTHLTLPTICSV